MMSEQCSSEWIPLINSETMVVLKRTSEEEGINFTPRKIQ